METVYSVGVVDTAVTTSSSSVENLMARCWEHSLHLEPLGDNSMVESLLPKAETL